jgi:hypothetical protein
MDDQKIMRTLAVERNFYQNAGQSCVLFPRFDRSAPCSVGVIIEPASVSLK